MPDNNPYPNSPANWFLDWWAQQQAKRLGTPVPGTVPAPIQAPGAPGGFVAPGNPAAPGGPSTDFGPAPSTSTAAVDTYDTTYPYPESTTDDLERYENNRKKIENDVHEVGKILSDPTKPADHPDKIEAQKRLDTYNIQYQAAIDRIAQEKNRRADNARADADKQRQIDKESKAEAEKRDATPKNGDTRNILREWTDPQGRKITGMVTETYNNGVWGYVKGSATADTGIPAGPGERPSVITDGQGTYWTVDPTTGQARSITGPKAAAKTITDPDGNIWLQNPDGTKGSKLFDAAPKTVTDNGRIIAYDPRSGAKIFETDTKTPEGRALADRLERANVAAAERQADPQFASAIAQYRAEAQRRQGLARTELARLQDLQKSGQLSPEMAEAQFDTWMQTNVEGPLAGFKAAAEQEQRKLEQENLTRQNAEEGRVETANRERGRLAYEADTAGRAISREIAQRTRAPEFIRDTGKLAASLASGRTDFAFSPESLDPANFKKALPNMDELADKAVQRLFSFVPEARARNVNVPLPEMPSGDNLRGMMDQVRYTPSAGAAGGVGAGSQVAEGQGAVDLKDQGRPGWARTVYQNGKYEDWEIPTTSSGQIAQLAAGAPPPAMASGGLPGQQEGETEEQRQARWRAIMSR